MNLNSAFQRPLLGLILALSVATTHGHPHLSELRYKAAWVSYAAGIANSNMNTGLNPVYNGMGAHALLGSLYLGFDYVFEDVLGGICALECTDNGWRDFFGPKLGLFLPLQDFGLSARGGFHFIRQYKHEIPGTDDSDFVWLTGFPAELALHYRLHKHFGIAAVGQGIFGSRTWDLMALVQLQAGNLGF